MVQSIKSARVLAHQVVREGGSSEHTGPYLLAEAAVLEATIKHQSTSLGRIRQSFPVLPAELSAPEPSRESAAWRVEEYGGAPVFFYVPSGARRTLTAHDQFRTVERVRISPSKRRIAVLSRSGSSSPSRLDILDGPSGDRWSVTEPVAFDAIWAGDDSTIFLSEQQGFEAKAVWFIELLRGGTTRASRLLMEAKDSGATLLLRRLPSYPFVLIERKRPDGNQFAAAYSSGNGALISAMTPFEGGVHYSAYGAPDEVVIVKHGPVRDALYRLPAQDFDWDQRRLGFEAKDSQFIEGVYPFQKRLLLLTRSLSEISIDALTLDNVLTNTCRLPGITRVREASIQGGDEISFGVGVLNRKSLITVTGDPHGCRVTELAPSGVQEAITLVPARDKTIIPVLTLTPAGKITGTLVQFYGSYGVTAWPTRTKLVNALLERQIQIVVPFVRGSGFMGPRWYESGRAGNKTNSFNDAEDVLRTLKAAARPLLLRGRSAGAALATTTADRLRGSVDGLILEYPVVDLVHTVSGKGMPLTERETLEWGELARPENAMTLRAISPRHLVDPQLPKLVLTLLGVDDPLVPIPSYLPWLAATRADERISLVSTFDTKGGHGDDLDQGSEEEWWALIVRAFEELQTGAP